MSCSSLGALDFLNLRNPLNLNSQVENKSNFDECNDSNLTLELFKRPCFDNGPRKPSLLEQSLLPGFSGDISPPSSADDTGAKTQLTIFYQGVINVYNDVPYEKAQAIMLLAGESSVSTSITKNLLKTDEKKATLSQQHLPLFCEFQSDLPIARKFSLKRFLEKRRERVSSKAPYPSPRTASDDGKKEKLQHYPSVLSPFPSRSVNSLTILK